MKRFIAHLNDGSHINIAADTIQLCIEDAYIIAYCEKKLVAILDVGCVLCAYISEKETAS